MPYREIDNPPPLQNTFDTERVIQDNSSGDHLNTSPHANNGRLPFDRIPAERLPVPKRDKYRASDIEKSLGIPSSNINHMIERMGLIAPEKNGVFGSKQVYEYSPEDISTIEHAQFLKDLGFKNKNVVQMVGDQETYEMISAHFFTAIANWREEPTSENWSGLINVLLQIPGLSEEQKYVFGSVMMGTSFNQCAENLSITEQEAKRYYDDAQNSLGSVIMRIFFGVSNR